MSKEAWTEYSKNGLVSVTHKDNSDGATDHNHKAVIKSYESYKNAEKPRYLIMDKNQKLTPVGKAA